MRVLHLFSNAKWTGPAEPALNLCVALRRAGVEADFACSPDAGASINKVVETARDRGIEPILTMQLRKHRHPIHNFADRRVLTRLLAMGAYDVVHCHLDNDHRIAMRSVRKCGIPLIRSSYEGTGFPHSFRHRVFVKQCDRLIEPSRRALEHDVATFGIPPEKAVVIPGAVDTERFNPTRDVPDGRKWLGIPPGAFVVGIVARMQRHRHFEDFFLAMRRLVDAYPETHVIVVGRGTYQETVGKTPVRELGLEGRVHFSGYVDGENYVGMLKAFDVKVFLVPGSDGTCRAVRESMAMGKPTIVSDRGMLREIVDDGVNGVVCDGSPDALVNALTPFAADRSRRIAFGREARRKAESAYSLAVQSASVLAVYESILAGRGRSTVTN